MNRAAFAGGHWSRVTLHSDPTCGGMDLIVGLGGPDVADGLQQPTMVEPFEQFERGVTRPLLGCAMGGIGGSPRFLEAVDCLGQSVTLQRRDCSTGAVAIAAMAARLADRSRNRTHAAELRERCLRQDGSHHFLVWSPVNNPSSRRKA